MQEQSEVSDSRHASIHNQHTSLQNPYRQDLHLLNDDRQFRAIDAPTKVVWGPFRYVVIWCNKVTIRLDDYLQESEENSEGCLLHVSRTEV